MTSSTGKTRCILCDKDRATLRCGGCLQEFCYKHSGDHRQELTKQLDEIEVNRDLFRQSLIQQIEQPNNHILIQQINQWEQESIKKIQQTAEETRQILFKDTDRYVHEIETNLSKLTDQLRDCRQEDDFNEINLGQFQEKLDRLTEELIQLRNISIQEDPTTFINKVYVEMPSKSANILE
jgi:hypothetical protein